ncbi:MAG: prepilin-type N-terminal cleavage/methylation domain-containing protein [Gammaproteobacteria bacterium]|jgi:type IV pilus assembly protein PilA|nr:prepilin-type N-terminal cleavage/methylation domain-containing protein [Gammaproteobacteria bacterium]
MHFEKPLWKIHYQTTYDYARHPATGFSLLELLLVVALIGILAAFAVPTYQNYMQQTRFMEVVQQSQAVRISQAACLMAAGQNLTACDSYTEVALQAPAATVNTATVTISPTTALITGTGTSAAGGYTYILTPSYNTAGQLVYTPSGTCVAAGAC